MGFDHCEHTRLLVASNSVPNSLASVLAQVHGILGTRDASPAVLCKIFHSTHILAGVVENLPVDMWSRFVHPVAALANKLEPAWERLGSTLHASQLMLLTPVQGLVLCRFDYLPQALGLPCLTFGPDFAAGYCIVIALL